MILCYHAVDPDWRSPLSVHPADFTAHAEWLAAHRQVLPLPEALAAFDRHGRLPRGSTALTFDDGFASVYDHAAGVLDRHRLPAAVFVVAETLTPQGRRVDWVDTPPPWPLRTLTPSQVLELHAAGWTIGSHSFSHRVLTELDPRTCEEDLRRSRELLEDLLGAPVTVLAYPRGRHDAAVRAAAARAGFSHGLALPERPEPAGPLAVPRAGVYPGNGPRALWVKTQPWYVPLRTSRVFPLLRRLSGRGPLPRAAG